MSVLSILNEFKVNSVKLFVLAAFFGLLIVKTVASNSPSSYDDDSDVRVEKLPFCDENVIHDREYNSKRLLYISTLDGRLSTLDLTNNGAVQWSIPTEPGDLLSSSIHRLELTNNGKYVRMIPSMTGGIYKFDGDSIEAIPVTAEELLKSSFKFSDDMVISGGKEVRSYGVNCRTGHIAYECSMNGCNKRNYTMDIVGDSSEIPQANFDPLLDDVLVVRRQTQTVRAIEPRLGTERWNFSIGHHELELLPSKNCRPGVKSDQADELDKQILDLDLRVIVPEGIVCGYSKATPNVVLWEHKFDSPIVSVYRSDTDNRLYSLDLFENAQWIKSSGDSSLAPSLYLGMYNQQLYIQESDNMRASIVNHNKLEHNLISDETGFPKIPFRPFPVTKEGLKLIEARTDPEERRNNPTELMRYDDKLNAQSVLYASPYADGKGFYFFTSKDYNHSTQCGKKTRSTHINPEDFDNVTFRNHGILHKRNSLWDYWKEIIVIAFSTALVVNVMLNNRRRQEREVIFVEREVPVPYGKEAIEFEEEEQQKKKDAEQLCNEIQAKYRSLSESTGIEDSQQQLYVSRFLTDFDLVQCLGKGGFGVVFEVKNKLDDCHYAIKRILLPDKKESRERVMREVKTLANCEHKNIVRYFHAWVEQPPKGWQEEKDKEWLERDIFSTSITIDSPSPSEESKAFMNRNEKRNINMRAANDSWLLNLQNKQFTDFSDGQFGQKSITTDDDSFIQFKADTNDKSVADCAEDDHQDDSDDCSFDIVFKNSTRNSEAHIEATTDNSHVISISASEDVKSPYAIKNGFCKKGHRRHLSLDLSTSSNMLAKKSNGITIPSTNKMYLYIQMQLCMKNSLKDWLMANDLEMRNGKTYEIWDQIIQAIHYIHLKGLIHRDLKPSNMFFALDGEIKIGDFGLVTDMADIPIQPLTPSSNSNSSASMSGGGDHDYTIIGHKKHTQNVGTSLYMSFEQARGLPYNYKVDIFSLGLILFELLNFFQTETERFKVLEGIRHGRFPDEFQKNYEEEHKLLKMMLSKQPEQRPTTYGIRARPPLNKIDDQVSAEWHFELPTRRRDSNRSVNNLSTSTSSSGK